MTKRERVLAAIEFRPPDKIPLQIYPAIGGLHEHGQKLLDLMKECGHDFGDLSGLTLPNPPPLKDFDPDGQYHAIGTDGWGTTWEHRIFGIWGHPIDWPLNDLSRDQGQRPGSDGRFSQCHCPLERFRTAWQRNPDKSNPLRLAWRPFAW